MRAPLWVMGLLLVAIVALVGYGYFTTPLPLGLCGSVRAPGCAAGAAGGEAAGGPRQTAATPTSRASAGQPLALGAVTITLQSVERNQELTGTAATPAGPVGSFSAVFLSIQNAGSESLSLQPSNFRLIDERGRTYAVDVEATRAVCTRARRRAPFEATVPPGGRLDTGLAFEPASDAGSLALRVSLGYGELALPG